MNLIKEITLESIPKGIVGLFPTHKYHARIDTMLGGSTPRSVYNTFYIPNKKVTFGIFEEPSFNMNTLKTHCLEKGFCPAGHAGLSIMISCYHKDIARILERSSWFFSIEHQSPFDLEVNDKLTPRVSLSPEGEYLSSLAVIKGNTPWRSAPAYFVGVK